MLGAAVPAIGRAVHCDAVWDERAAAIRGLLRAARLYRDDPDGGCSQLRGAYIDAVNAGIATERIEALTGFSISELNERVGEP